jgi:sulfonate transport system substrate-binding protein
MPKVWKRAVSTSLFVGVLCGSGSFVATSASAALPSGSVSTAGVTLNIGNIDNSSEIPWVLAQYKTPYKVNWVNFTDAPPLLQALQSNAINVGVPGVTGVIDAQYNGLVFRAVAEFSSPGTSMVLLVPKGSKVTSVSQLKGQTVAVYRGSAGEGFLVEALKRAGLNESDISIVNLQPAAAAPAFASGKVAAWAIWVPFSTVAEAKDGAKVLESGRFWPEVGYFVAKQSTIAQPAYAAAIANFLTLYKKAEAAETVAGVAAQYEKGDHLPAALAVPIAKATIGGTVLPINSATYKTYTSTIDDFSAAHLVPGKPNNPLSIFTTQFNSAISSS